MSTTMIYGSHLTLTFKFSTHSTHVRLYYYMLEIPIVMGYSQIMVLHIQFRRSNKTMEFCQNDMGLSYLKHLTYFLL